MALSIFYCDCLDLGTGPEAARLDVSYMRDNFFNVGIKAAVLFTKGLHRMHWHARVARSVVLALTFLIMTTRTQTTRYVCLLRTTRHIHKCLSHDQGSEDTHWQISYVRSGRLGHPRNYAGDKAD